jgi:hypothetical protein
MESDLGRVWKDVAPLLEPALAEGETLPQVLTALFNKSAQLWIGADKTGPHVACVTELVRKGGSYYCNIWLAGGKGINNWIYFLETIEAWAREQGCNGMLIAQGRVGWPRIPAFKEYKVKSIMLVKEIR